MDRNKQKNSLLDMGAVTLDPWDSRPALCCLSSSTTSGWKGCTWKNQKAWLLIFPRVWFCFLPGTLQEGVVTTDKDLSVQPAHSVHTKVGHQEPEPGLGR